MIETSPILITGCARSGTSMVSGTINMCGAFGGEMSGPNRNNPKGMFENVAVRNMVKDFYRSINVDHMGQYPLVNIGRLNIPQDWKARVHSIFLRQGYKGGPWFYKGAKCCQHWPVWHYAFPNAKWIIVRRKDKDIVRSCLRTSFMRAFRNEEACRAVNAANESEGWEWWVRQHKRRFVEMVEAGLNTKVVCPDKMIHGDFSQMKDAVEWAGLRWTNEVYDFISPKLWKRDRR